jgi:CRISPR/Cas system-associated protein Cas10 (large subunit of type III CRISPR-Cas system)
MTDKPSPQEDKIEEARLQEASNKNNQRLTNSDVRQLLTNKVFTLGNAYERIVFIADLLDKQLVKCLTNLENEIRESKKILQEIQSLLERREQP